MCSYIRSYMFVYLVNIRRISSVYGWSIREPKILYVHIRMCTYVVCIRTYNVCIMQLYKHIRTYTNAHTNVYKHYTDGTYASVYACILFVYVLKIRPYMTCIYKMPEIRQINIRTNTAQIRESCLYTSPWQQLPLRQNRSNTQQCGSSVQPSKDCTRCSIADKYRSDHYGVGGVDALGAAAPASPAPASPASPASSPPSSSLS